jgi:hypothetical protein
MLITTTLRDEVNAEVLAFVPPPELRSASPDGRGRRLT